MIEEKETIVDAQTEQQVVEENKNQSESQQESKNAANEFAAEDELSAFKKEIEEQKDKYLRLFAEFDNFKKRNAKERLELFKTAGQDIVRELLPVLDDFNRADKVYQQDNNAENFVVGLKLIQEKFHKTLQNKGLKAIDSIGKDFDVAQHEAIAEVPAPTPELAGKILDEVETGYTLNDTSIRYAKVVVGK